MVIILPSPSPCELDELNSSLERVSKVQVLLFPFHIRNSSLDKYKCIYDTVVYKDYLHEEKKTVVAEKP